MQDDIKSKGRCFFCGKSFAKAGINRHLVTHFREKEKTGLPGKSFLVKIETNRRWGSSPYFLSLWIDGETKLKDLDSFLRDIWLECCNHMSAFRDPNKGALALFEDEDDIEFEGMDEDDDDIFGIDDENVIPMDCKTKNLFSKGLELDFDYDFGSTTELSMTVMEEYSVRADAKIVLLSRNEPLKIMCAVCGISPASLMCTVCMYNGGSVFCEKCAVIHAKQCKDFKDYAAMPVVNSPRMGVCGYTGGVIDTERDGIYQ